MGYDIKKFDAKDVGYWWIKINGGSAQIAYIDDNKLISLVGYSGGRSMERWMVTHNFKIELLSFIESKED